MKISFCRPEGGNITVVCLDNLDLLIRCDIPGTFIVSSPTTKQFHLINISNSMTPDEIFKKIDDYYNELGQDKI